MKLSQNSLFIILLTVFLICPCAFSQMTFAQTDDSEMYFIAQKAFDDGFYDVAIRYVDQFLTQFPQSPKHIEANLLLGQCYFFKGQYLKALETFKAQLQYPDQKDATIFWLGETYLKGLDFKQAEKQYRQVIESYPDSLYVPQAYYSLGWSLFEAKDFVNAKLTFSEFVKKFPTHELTEDSIYKIAESDFQLRDYPATIAMFQEFSEKFPQSKHLDEAYFYIGECYYYQGDFAKAVDFYSKVAAVSQSDKVILMSKIAIGWSYFKLKDFEHSKQYFDEAQAISQQKNIPSDDIDLGRANLSVEMGNYQAALEAYENFLTHFPNSPRLIEANLGKANVFYLMKNFSEAINTYRTLIDKIASNPHYAEWSEKAYFGLAWSYLKDGQPEQAIKTFEEIANRATSKDVKVSAYSQIGDSYQDIGDYNKALEVYDKVLKDYPDSLYADYLQYRQGIALLKLERIEAATLNFQSLQANFPKSNYISDIKYYLGVAYFKKGDWASAKDQLVNFMNTISTTNEFLPDAQYLLGLSLFNLQEYAEAIKVFQKIIKSNPEETTLVANCEINIAKCIYNSGDVKEALTKFKIIAYKYPRSDAELEALLWLGDYYQKSSDFSNAETYYQQLIEFFPGSEKVSQAHFGLGQIYQEQGTVDKAISEFKLIGESANRDLYAKAQMSIADIFSKDNDPDIAVESFKKITSTSPEYKRDALVKIAETYRGNRDYENALKSFAEALQSEIGQSKIKNVEIQFNIADIYETEGKSTLAIDEYFKIPYLYPDAIRWNIKAYLRLGRIYEKLEDWENARLAYQKILELNTDESKIAQERLDWITNNTFSTIK